LSQEADERSPGGRVEEAILRREGFSARIAGCVRRRARFAVVLVSALAGAVLALPAGGQASSPSDVQLKVMTRNLYLGADLTPAIQATTSNGFIDANGQIVR